MKKPAFQFYPGDWRKDQNLSRASLRAKGALIEVLCLAFECEKRGYLKTGKTPWTIEEIAHAMGGDKMENISAIEELLQLKVLKKDKKNTIFSARMARDEKISKVRRKAGSQGGNPILLNQRANQKTTPSSSSSTSDNTTTNVVVDSRAGALFEMFRRTAGRHIGDDELWVEVGKFLNKYPNIHPNRAGALVNTWVANIGKQPVTEKKMVI